jgi:hypothetical protein
MKKHNQIGNLPSCTRGVRLAIKRETVRILTRHDLGLIAAGEGSTIITERPTRLAMFASC